MRGVGPGGGRYARLDRHAVSDQRGVHAELCFIGEACQFEVVGESLVVRQRDSKDGF